jgi:hypothetical protein
MSSYIIFTARSSGYDSASGYGSNFRMRAALEMARPFFSSWTRRVTVHRISI